MNFSVTCEEPPSMSDQADLRADWVTAPGAGRHVSLTMIHFCSSASSVFTPWVGCYDLFPCCCQLNQLNLCYYPPVYLFLLLFCMCVCVCLPAHMCSPDVPTTPPPSTTSPLHPIPPDSTALLDTQVQVTGTVPPQASQRKQEPFSSSVFPFPSSLVPLHVRGASSWKHLQAFVVVVCLFVLMSSLLFRILLLLQGSLTHCMSLSCALSVRLAFQRFAQQPPTPATHPPTHTHTKKKNTSKARKCSRSAHRDS